MKILHYSLGLPPYRSGGLTKYSLDLMDAQTGQGQEVTLLFPGHYNLTKNRVIKKQSQFEDIQVYELINPMPVPLLGGVYKPENFMDDGKSANNYDDFLSMLNPDIIHIHTLMGLPSKLIEIAKNKGIKLVFTTHDYYGICPKVNMIDYQGNICDDYDRGMKCSACNLNAYTLPMIYVMQSRIYRLLKNNQLIKKLRANKKKQIISGENELKIQQMFNVDSLSGGQFIVLRSYYIKILKQIDLIHYNSEITKSVYEQHFSNQGVVLPISHGNIEDKRILKIYNQKEPLQIGFLGPIEDYKGFTLLRRSLMKLLQKKQTNWHLHVYGNNGGEGLLDYISFQGKYSHHELESIFQTIDVLIIPSIWNETFGFIGLEAMAHGVPCIVSDTVGFKDMVENQKTGLIVKPDELELSEAISNLIDDRQALSGYNHNICNQPFTYSMNTHTIKMNRIYNKVLGDK